MEWTKTADALPPETTPLLGYWKDETDEDGEPYRFVHLEYWHWLPSGVPKWTADNGGLYESAPDYWVLLTDPEGA